MIKGKMGFTTCFDRQAGEVSKFSAYGMFSDFLFQTTTYAVRGEAYGSSKMTTYNVRGEASKGLSLFLCILLCKVRTIFDVIFYCIFLILGW
mgnify:CR=1 FL=1